MQVFAHTRGSRSGVTALRMVAAANVFYLAWILALDFLEGTQNAPPIAVAIGLAAFSIAPLVLARAIASSRRLLASVSIEPETLVVALPRERIEVPLANISEVRPLALPLPSPGLVLRLRSGRMFERALCTLEVDALLSALAAHVPSAEDARGHPMVKLAAARSPRSRARLIIFGLGVLPLVVTAIIFRLHQHIVYGGLLGQYYAMGLGPYLESLFVRWLGITGAFMVIAGVLVSAVSAAIYAGTWIFPNRARAVRIAAETSALIIYFAGVPGYLAVLLLLD